MKNFVAKVKQLGVNNSRPGHGRLHSNSRDVPIVAVDRKDMPDGYISPHGLRILGPGAKTKHHNLQQVTMDRHSARPANDGSLQRDIRLQKSPEPSGGRNMKQERIKQVEEVFQFIPTGEPTEQSGQTVLWPQNHPPSHPQTQTSSHHGLVRILGNDKTDKPRKGPYRSVREYEEAQRKRNITSSGGLHTTFGSESLAPHMELVLKGNEYSIEETGDRLAHQSINSKWRRLPKQWDGNRSESTGLQMVMDGRFPQQKRKPALRSAPDNNATLMRRQRNQLEIHPQQMSNQLQVFPHSSTQTHQPK